MRWTKAADSCNIRGKQEGDEGLEHVNEAVVMVCGRMEDIYMQ